MGFLVEGRKSDDEYTNGCMDGGMDESKDERRDGEWFDRWMDRRMDQLKDERRMINESIDEWMELEIWMKWRIMMMKGLMNKEMEECLNQRMAQC